jgi:hypothetical protein
MTTYSLTLCDPDGTLMAVVPEAPALPRFLHVTAGAMQLSDEAEPADELGGVNHVTTFQRIASSVWIDDERDALFVRVVA